MLTTKEEQYWLLEQARLIAKNSYAPYSKFHVGACVLYENGDYYLGCNVENASFGLSLCAERNALSNAVTAGEKGAIRSIGIVSLEQKNCLPCGACRQWIYEFASQNGSDINIVVEDDKGEIKSYKISELLPAPFRL